MNKSEFLSEFSGWGDKFAVIYKDGSDSIVKGPAEFLAEYVIDWPNVKTIFET